MNSNPTIKTEDAFFEYCHSRDFRGHRVIGIFAAFTYCFCKADFFQEVCVVLVCYGLMLNEWGWQKLAEWGRIPMIPQRSFLKEQGGEMMPDFVNLFMHGCFEEALGNPSIIAPDFRLKNLGMKGIGLLRLLLIVKHFCHWLTTFGFSSANINIVKE
jgi:hypothetical protein